MENAIDQLPTWITTLCWIITLIIFWFILIQIGIMLQAINNLTGERVKTDAITYSKIPPIPMQAAEVVLNVNDQDSAESSKDEKDESTQASTSETAIQRQDAP
jgi:hypothetical protein